VSFPLHLVVDPAFEPRLDRALCARCMCVACCPASRRRADLPSLESRPSSRAGRLQVPLPTATRALLACIVLILTRRAHAEFRLAVGTHTLSTHTVAPPPFGTHSHEHPRVESLNSLVQPVHTCAPLGPKFYFFWVGDSWPNTHRREPGMPVPPTCLRRSGSFPLCRRA
jgi:hypothetical protein